MGSDPWIPASMSVPSWFLMNLNEKKDDEGRIYSLRIENMDVFNLHARVSVNNYNASWGYARAVYGDSLMDARARQPGLLS